MALFFWIISFEKKRSSGTLYNFANFSTCDHEGNDSPFSHPAIKSFSDADIFSDAARVPSPIFSRAIRKLSLFMDLTRLISSIVQYSYLSPANHCSRFEEQYKTADCYSANPCALIC